jgi:hypothetical protein
VTDDDDDDDDDDDEIQNKFKTRKAHLSAGTGREQNRSVLFHITLD